MELNKKKEQSCFKMISHKIDIYFGGEGLWTMDSSDIDFHLGIDPGIDEY